jgi:hypothetical protein
MASSDIEGRNSGMFISEMFQNCNRHVFERSAYVMHARFIWIGVVHGFSQNHCVVAHATVVPQIASRPE